MLIKQKIAVSLTALSLMSLVAIAPAASAFPINSNPYVELQDGDVQDEWVDANTTVGFDVYDVRHNCVVTTTLGSKKVKDKAVAYDLEEGLAGEVADGEIKTPKVAGIYDVKSTVSKSCKSDSGHKSSATIYVGQNLYFDFDYEDVADNNLATLVYGTIQDEDGLSVDVEDVVVQFYKGAKLIAKGTADSSGYISEILPSKAFKAAGTFDITVKLAPNADYYMDNDEGDNVFEIDVEAVVPAL